VDLRLPDVTTTSTNNPKPRRRRLQFSLRRLMVLVILICVLLGLLVRLEAPGVTVFLFCLGIVVLVVRRNQPTAVIGVILMLLSPIPLAVWDMGPRWIGRKSYSLLVRVVDSRSGSPIAGASVRIFDPDVDPNASGVQTDIDGTATVTTVLTIVGTDNLLWDRGSIYLWRHNIHVTAEGYAPVKAPLERFIGQFRDLYGDPIPPIRIEMERAGAAEAQQ